MPARNSAELRFVRLARSTHGWVDVACLELATQKFNKEMPNQKCSSAGGSSAAGGGARIKNASMQLEWTQVQPSAVRDDLVRVSCAAAVPPLIGAMTAGT